METASQITPLPGSDEISRNGSFWQYNNYKIWEGNAYFSYNPPVYGRTGFRRKCWIVQKPNKARWILTGTPEDVERCIDKDLNRSEDFDRSVNENSDTGREDEQHQRSRYAIRRGFKRPSHIGKENNNETDTDLP